MSGAAMFMVYGGAPGVVAPSVSLTSSNAVAITLLLNNAGALSVDPNAGTWVTPATAVVAAYYEVKVDVTAGSFTSGSATGSFLSLGTSRSWTKSVVGSVTYTITIREIATGIVRYTSAGNIVTAT